MWRCVASFLVLAVLGGAPPSAVAQTASATARVGAGQTAQATAAPVPGDGVLLEIALPGGRSQRFPQLGMELVPLSGKTGDQALVARDLNGDGVDELIIRGSVPPRGALLVFRWDRTMGEFVPVEFTDDRDQTTKYLVVDFRLPVLIGEPGMIEAHYESARPDGRVSGYVARYRWTEEGFSLSPDN